MNALKTRKSDAFTRFCVPKLQSGLYFCCIFIFIYVSLLLQRKRAVPAHDSFLLLIQLILPMILFASADFKSTVNLLNQQ